MEPLMERQNIIIPFLKTRIFAYDLLRRTFLEEPSPAYLEMVSQPGLIEDFPFSGESEKIFEGNRLVAAYLKKDDAAGQDAYDRLHWDYTRMFVGPYKLPAPPWESAYLNEQRLLFQKETLQVRYAYLKYGFRPRHFRQEADDHLGLELDFMFQLAKMALEKLKAGDLFGLSELVNDSRAFLEAHLLKWVPDLTRDVVENADTDFYKGMAKILHGYLELDLKALSELSEYWGALN